MREEKGLEEYKWEVKKNERRERIGKYRGEVRKDERRERLGNNE